MYEFFQPEKPFEAEVIALFVQIVWKRRHIKKLDGLRGQLTALFHLASNWTKSSLDVIQKERGHPKPEVNQYTSGFWITSQYLYLWSNHVVTYPTIGCAQWKSRRAQTCSPQSCRWSFSHKCCMTSQTVFRNRRIRGARSVNLCLPSCWMCISSDQSSARACSAHPFLVCCLFTQ